MEETPINRLAKNTVFCSLFSHKKYLLQLYRALHPEDADATEDDLIYLTLTNILVNGIYNDLGFMVKGRFIILVEAQSTWSPNIVIRALMYLMSTYQEYFHSTQQRLYGSACVDMPKPELYVVYTNERGNHPDVLSLQKEFFNGEEICIEAKAKVIYLDDSDTIINQYIKFCMIFNEQVRKYGMTIKAVKETIRICKDNNLLREYLQQREVEVEGIMITLFNQDREVELYGNEKFNSGLSQGISQGISQGKAEEKIQSAKNLIASGLVTFPQLETSGLYTAEELSAIAMKN